ncbi:unnamed protein product [Brugia pahangi]|uniref:Uncharacterized protein n=1 Tax=Brugia pahangi TaxID=6280 RepID=A0A0N4TXP4_BRUPA|nr:unnamed protein product [Brugia pahangi]
MQTSLDLKMDSVIQNLRSKTADNFKVGFYSIGIGRGGLRDPDGRNRDRERNGNRGLQQQQLHNNSGRRYCSDNRNRMLRYRDYDDDR